MLFRSAAITEAQIDQLAREVVREGCDAVAIVCTNMRGAAVAAAVERDLGTPVYDSIATTLWKSLSVTGVDTRRVQGWGGVFEMGTRPQDAVPAPAAVERGAP